MDILTVTDEKKSLASAAALPEQMAIRLKDLRPVYRAIGNIVVESVRGNFRESRSPDNVPWPPLKKPDHGRTRPLVDTGRLMESVAASIDLDGLVVGSDLPYAPIHQFGGRTKDGRETVPARPFLGVRTEDTALISEALVRYVTGEERRS